MIARSGFRDSDGWKWLADIRIRNLGTTTTKLVRGASSVHWEYAVSAGTGSSSRDPVHVDSDPGVSMWSKSNKACVSTPRRHVPLSSAGLSGGDASHFEEGFQCAGLRRVLVRVRAVLAVPASFRLDRRFLYLEANAPVQEGSIAARTVSGRPLVFARVKGSGKARIFTAPSCIPE